MRALARSYLFAPGHREELLRKSLEAGADAVVFDLEDAVPPSERPAARRRIASVLAAGRSAEWPAIWVRINSLAGEGWREDLAAVVGPAVGGLRLPKVDSREAVLAAEEALAMAEERSGLSPGTTALALTIESARGVLAAGDLATCARVRHLVFGAADFAADVAAEPGEDELETLHARSQLVVVSRAAGLQPPVAGAYTRLDDVAGLARSTRAARRLGFFGRSCLHPRQVPIVNEAFTPHPEELSRAQQIVRAHAAAAASRSGSSVLPDGQFVDAAVVRRAQALLDLADGLAERERVTPS